MIKYFKSISVLIALAMITACGSKVEVPPAHVGKILGKNGYAPDTIPPTKFRLPFCVSQCDRLVLLEASDTSLKEKMVIFMPDDRLNLSVDIRGTYSVTADATTVNAIYDRVVAAEVDSSQSIISAAKVYGTYGQQAVRGIVRSEITKYTIQDILANRESIGQNIHAAIVAKLKSTKTPIAISRFELADVQPPAVIVAAQEAAKEREIDIQKAEADAQVDIVKAERSLEVAKKERLVEREKAEAIAEQNKIAAKSITPQLLAYRRLEVAEKIYADLAKSDSAVIVVPADSSGFSSLNDNAVLAKMLGQQFKGK